VLRQRRHGAIEAIIADADYVISGPVGVSGDVVVAPATITS
jgi:hypothetical protein